MFFQFLTVILFYFFFLMIRRPPRSTLFPYTTPSDLLHLYTSTLFTLYCSFSSDTYFVFCVRKQWILRPIQDGRTHFVPRNPKSPTLNFRYIQTSYAGLCFEKKKHTTTNTFIHLLHFPSHHTHNVYTPITH